MSVLSGAVVRAFLWWTSFFTNGIFMLISGDLSISIYRRRRAAIVLDLFALLVYDGPPRITKADRQNARL